MGTTKSPVTKLYHLKSFKENTRKIYCDAANVRNKTPFSEVILDSTERLSSSPNSKLQFVLLCQVRATRFFKAKPVPGLRTKTIIDFYAKLVLIYGTLYLHQLPAHMSFDLKKAFCTNLGIRLKYAQVQGHRNISYAERTLANFKNSLRYLTSQTREA